MTSNDITGEKGSQALPKSARVLKNREFSRIQKNSRRLYSKNFTVLIARQTTLIDRQATSERTRQKAPANNRLAVKLGITVSKKTEASAVKRNRMKRIIREAFRLIKQQCTPGLVLVVIAKSDCFNLSSQQVRAEMLSLLKNNKCLL